MAFCHLWWPKRRECLCILQAQQWLIRIMALLGVKDANGGKIGQNDRGWHRWHKYTWLDCMRVGLSDRAIIMLTCNRFACPNCPTEASGQATVRVALVESRLNVEHIRIWSSTRASSYEYLNAALLFSFPIVSPPILSPLTQGNHF